MKKMVIILIFILSIGLIIIGIYGYRNLSATEDIEEYNNDFFTKDLYINLKKIILVYGSDEINIRKRDFHDFYMKLASLNLSEMTHYDVKVGQQMIKLVTKDGKIIDIGLLSDEIGIRNNNRTKIYKTDKDIVSDLRKIALK